MFFRCPIISHCPGSKAKRKRKLEIEGEKQLCLLGCLQQFLEELMTLKSTNIFRDYLKKQYTGDEKIIGMKVLK